MNNLAFKGNSLALKSSSYYHSITILRHKTKAEESERKKLVFNLVQTYENGDEAADEKVSSVIASAT